MKIMIYILYSIILIQSVYSQFSMNVSIGDNTTCLTFESSSFNVSIYTPWNNIFTNITYNYFNYTMAKLFINGVSINIDYYYYGGLILDPSITCYPGHSYSDSNSPIILPQYFWTNYGNVVMYDTNYSVTDPSSGQVFLFFNNAGWECATSGSTPTIGNIFSCSLLGYMTPGCPSYYYGSSYDYSNHNCSYNITTNQLGLNNSIYMSQNYEPKYLNDQILIYNDISLYGNIPDIIGCYIENCCDIDETKELIFVGDTYIIILTDGPEGSLIIYFKKNLQATTDGNNFLGCDSIYNIYNNGNPPVDNNNNNTTNNHKSIASSTVIKIHNIITLILISLIITYNVHSID
jgi:hypothetical protein